MVYQFRMNRGSDRNDNSGKLPVYLQIAEQLSREISAGLLAEGQRLPAERQMAKDYNVTVRTLRKSLARLTETGLLARKQGSGNYIQKNENADSIYSFFRLERPQGGGLPSANLVRVDSLKKPKSLPGFGGSSFAHRFRRQRFLDGLPVAAEEIWLDQHSAAKVNEAQVSQSLYKYYKERLDVWIVRVEDWVGLSEVPQWADGLLAIAPGIRCGFIERYGWSEENKKVEYSRTWYDADAARYVSRLK